jgi:hypothetical protein
MAKFCRNGHQMEDSWEICPYCQRTGYQAGTSSAAAGKTRLETEPDKPAVGRKTVLLTEKRKAPVVGWLVAMSGEQKGEDFRLREGQNALGSSPDAEVLIRDSTISAKHASLRYKEGKFYLTDLDSTNGTYLNDRAEAITREELKDNDVIRLGDVSLKFKCL